MRKEIHEVSRLLSVAVKRVPPPVWHPEHGPAREPEVA
eukprot:CAMPEP_0179857724 /NCGR_PEP_ID=MMETSP0982-20121206/11926_1 /TAXON_ID=483367 /ORGANISM="non described non described, Strain CCMP 2436" /LENGTH=37 /DNA_ID= /DNA_START= /DNA_END= /DNA_ORIENTATION=